MAAKSPCLRRSGWVLFPECQRLWDFVSADPGKLKVGGQLKRAFVVYFPSRSLSFIVAEHQPPRPAITLA